MALYVIRIELEGSPKKEVYDKLHAKLHALKIYTGLRADDGAVYALPHATYSYFNETRFSTIFLHGWLQPHLTALRLGHRFKILIVESGQWAISRNGWID